MNKHIIKLFTLSLTALLYLNNHAAMPDIEWGTGIQSLHEAGPDTPQVGTLWGIAARKDDVQITLKLQANNDMTKGAWLGDIRSSEKFYSSLYLIDKNNKRYFIKTENAAAVGPDAEYGSWKKGPATAEQQMLVFQIDYGKIKALKNAKSLVINYASFDTPKETRDIVFPLDGFNEQLETLEASIKSVNGGKRFLMTNEEIDNTPMQELPIVIQQQREKDVHALADTLGMSVAELRTYSFAGMQTLLNKHKEQEQAALLERRKKSFQAIYDQEPDWLKLNTCPDRSNSYCKDIGKQGYETRPMIGDPIHYGTIIGVVWRPVDSIVRIYGGDAALNLTPEIYRAETARYYYIVQNKNEYLDIRPVDAVTAK
jgi:hypothetical protein